MPLMTLKIGEANASVLVIRQSETYGAVLEGRMSAELNQRTITRALAKAEQLWPGLPAVILQPGTGESELLPRVECMSLLESDQPVANAGGDISRLVLIHFEDEITPHFSESTRRRIAEMDWSAHAKSGRI